MHTEKKKEITFEIEQLKKEIELGKRDKIFSFQLSFVMV